MQLTQGAHEQALTDELRENDASQISVDHEEVFNNLGSLVSLSSNPHCNYDKYNHGEGLDEREITGLGQTLWTVGGKLWTISVKHHFKSITVGQWRPEKISSRPIPGCATAV